MLAIPMLLPILSGALIGFYKPLREPRVQKTFFIAVLSLNTAIVLAIVLQPDASLEVFRLADRMPILFKTDDLARYFCTLASVMFLIVGIYSSEYMRGDSRENIFHMFFLIVLGMLMGFGFSGNLMTLYLYFELMTLVSVPLVLHSMKKEAIEAALKFLYYSISGASMAMLGLFFVSIYGTTIEFTPGGVLHAQQFSDFGWWVHASMLMTIIGFSAKAGMFPLHAWLPDAHPVAPAPASAILSGVITKAGVFAVLRYVYYIVGSDFIRNTWIQTSWISLALFTVIMGSLLALREPELKRRLAYSSISQVSYISFGLSILTLGGLVGAMLHIVFHSIVKNALFLSAGIIINRTKKTKVADLRGYGRQIPVTMGCFALLAVTMVGVPPTSEFVSKWYLSISSLAAADIGFFTWLGPLTLMVSALLSAGYLLPIAIYGFFPGKGQELSEEKIKYGNSFIVPIVLLTAAGVGLGIFPNALLSFLERIAGMLL